MSNDKHPLLRANLKQLKLPTMQAEFEKLAREAVSAGESHEQYLLRLSELELAARSANALQARIRAADFPVHKDFDTFDLMVRWYSRVVWEIRKRPFHTSQVANPRVGGGVSGRRSRVTTAHGFDR